MERLFKNPLDVFKIWLQNPMYMNLYKSIHTDMNIWSPESSAISIDISMYISQDICIYFISAYEILIRFTYIDTCIDTDNIYLD